MTGRIKLFNGDMKLQETDDPSLGYEYDMPSGFDAECGTFLLNDFTLPNDECPAQFVCDTSQSTPDFQRFASCIDAMNCHMMAGMTTGSSSNSEVALFIHQMIPHHQNAVNMAKALLMTNKLKCDDLSVESSDCAMEVVLREIINSKNFQIQVMRGVLAEMNLPPEDDCKVPIAKDKGGSSTSGHRILLGNLSFLFLVVGCGAWLMA